VLDVLAAPLAAAASESDRHNLARAWRAITLVEPDRDERQAVAVLDQSAVGDVAVLVPRSLRTPGPPPMMRTS
jgi:hypothetical protein